MSNEVVKLQNQIVNLTPDQLKLITNTIAKNATPDELQLFLYRCKNMGLDPLKPGQIHFVKYGAGSPGTIVVGIEGFRSIAGRTGKLSGIARGAIKDDQGKLIGGWAEVSRKDWEKPAREEVPLSEYNTGRGPWQKMPETMIKKVAEAAALRMAFPDDLGGVYESSEMDQADKGGVHPEQPGPDDGHQADPRTLGKFTRGTHARKAPSEIDINVLRTWATGLEARISNPKTPIPDDEKEEWAWNLKLAVDYIIEFENNDVPDFGNEPGAEI